MPQEKTNRVPVRNIDLNDLVGALSQEYSDWQGNPSERFTIITDDGLLMSFGGGDRRNVAVPLGDIVRNLAYNGKNLANVKYFAHNHNRGDDFSPTDRDTYNQLKKLGFAGEFQIFHPEKKRIKTYNDPEIAKAAKAALKDQFDFEP